MQGGTSLVERLCGRVGTGQRGLCGVPAWSGPREDWGASCLTREQLDFLVPPVASNVGEVTPLLERSALGGRDNHSLWASALMPIGPRVSKTDS